MNFAADISAQLRAPVVLLYASVGPGLILRRPTGVYYVNQAGGYQCLQEYTEGVYLPLAGFLGADAELLDGLQHHFHDKYEGWGGFDAESADALDRLLHAHLSPGVSVDRARIADSTEVWVNVLVSDGAPKELAAGFGSGAAVLTWPNSD